MPRKDKNFKHAAMHDWAQGMSLRELAEKTGVAVTTLLRWKDNNDPAKWGDYQDALVRELQSAAIVKTKKEFASCVSGQLADALDLRTINRKLIGDFARLIQDKVSKEEGSDEEKQIKYIPTVAALKIMRDLTRSAASIQTQMNHVFGLPTHRVSSDNQATPLSAFHNDDVDLDGMTEKEIAAYIIDLNRGIAAQDGEG